MTVAFVFPGQGAQSIGMGLDLAARYPEARAVFDTVDAALPDDRPPLSQLCAEGPLEALTLTANTQPAILAASLACLAALRSRLPGLAPSVVAGHSLGEYSALVCAGALGLADAARLLRLRAEAMQAAVAPGEGAMSAILLLDDAAVTALCDEVRAELPGRVVSPANFNAPNQVVVAGHADAVARVAALAAQRRGKAIALKVSAPFHCALMAPAAESLRAALRAHPFVAPTAPVVANVDGALHPGPEGIADRLVAQVAGAVRWADGVRAMQAAGVTTYVEVGPGEVLTGLIKRVHKGATLLSVRDAESLDRTVEALGPAVSG